MKQMHKTLLGLLALLAVAFAIGAVAVWAGKDEEKKTEAKEKSEKLFDFDKAQAQALRIDKDGKLVVALDKGKTGWSVTAPVQAEADEQAVSSLLGELAGLRQKKDLGDEKNGKDYGLDAPRLQLTVRLEGGKEQGLQVGLDNTFDNTLYVRKLGDSTIRIVDGYVKGSLDKGLFDLRNKKVARLDDGAQVQRVEVSGEVKAPYTLVKDGAGWKLGGGAPADASTAERVVSAVRQLRATAVAAEKADLPAQYGLDLPRAVVRLAVGSGKDGFTRTVSIGQPAPGRGTVAVKTYARSDDSPVVFVVDNGIVKDLDKDAFDLRDKALVHVDREAVRKIVFDGPEGKVEIGREKPPPPDGGFAEEEFTVLSPKAGPAKKWKISSALYSITGLHAAAFDGPVPKDLAKYGLDKPRTVTLLGDKDKLLARVRFGAEKDGKRYALSDGVAELAQVDKSTVDDLPWTSTDAVASK